MHNRHRSMDLLRSAAILIVILAHTILSYGSPSHLAPLQFGGTGVDLFFVLSGWLLGGQLFKEINTSGRVDIKRFWVRRWMRTLPAYYVVLIFSVSQRLITKENVSFPFDFFAFIQNYNYPLEFFSVSWSLCVEEQFYLAIAPLLAGLAICKRRTTTITLLTLLVLPIIFRQLELYGHKNETHVRLDGCVIGVLLAQIHHQYKNTWDKLTTYAPIVAALGLACYLFFFYARYTPSLNIKDPDKLFLVILFGSWVVLANANNIWREKLYIPGAQYIATRAYALYLLHPEILALLKRFALDLPFFMYLFLAITGSILISEALYRLIEKPIMDKRELFTLSKSD